MNPLPSASPQKMNHLEQANVAIARTMEALYHKRPVKKNDIIAALALAEFYTSEYYRLLNATLHRDTRQTRKPTELTDNTKSLREETKSLLEDTKSLREEFQKIPRLLEEMGILPKQQKKTGPTLRLIIGGKR